MKTVYLTRSLYYFKWNNVYKVLRPVWQIENAQLIIIKKKNFRDLAKASNSKHLLIQPHLKDIEGSVPDHHNKAYIEIKWVAQNVWFPSAYKIYAYTIIIVFKCLIALYLKNVHTLKIFYC